MIEEPLKTITNTLGWTFIYTFGLILMYIFIV